MKKIINLIFMCLVLFAPGMFAQSAFDTNTEFKPIGQTGLVYTWEGTVDTVNDTLISREFFLADYDNDANPIFTLSAELSGGTTSTQKVSCQLIGSNIYDGTFASVDTFMTADSALTPIYKSVNTNSKKYARYKLRIFGTTGNVETDFKFALYLYKRDY